MRWRSYRPPVLQLRALKAAENLRTHPVTSGEEDAVMGGKETQWATAYLSLVPCALFSDETGRACGSSPGRGEGAAAGGRCQARQGVGVHVHQRVRLETTDLKPRRPVMDTLAATHSCSQPKTSVSDSHTSPCGCVTEVSFRRSSQTYEYVTVRDAAGSEERTRVSQKFVV